MNKYAIASHFLIEDELNLNFVDATSTEHALQCLFGESAIGSCTEEMLDSLANQDIAVTIKKIDA